MLKLFLVERPDVASHGQFQSFVVACATKDEARNTDPSIGHPDEGYWPKDIADRLKVTEIGVAHGSVKPGIVLANYIER